MKKANIEFKREIEAAEFGEAWPFIVKKGTLIHRDLAIIFKTEDGKEYAINGVAQNRSIKEKRILKKNIMVKKYLSIIPIWKEDKVSGEGFRISLSSIIKLGLELNPIYKT